MFKRIILGLCFVVFASFAYQFVDRQFREANILFQPPFRYTVDPPTSDQTTLLNTIFSRPIRYLDRGRQSYVFSSDDRQYVIKFFDAGVLKPSLFGRSLATLEKRTKRLFEGYQVAYTKSRDVTGLVYTQLAPTKLGGLKGRVIDRFGFEHSIYLERVPFVVQKKVIPTREVITELLEKGEVEKAKLRLRAIVDLYVSEYQQGLIDGDRNFMYNSGFIDGNVVRIDAGRLRIDTRYKDIEVFYPDLKKIALGRVSGWLGRHFPEYKKLLLADMKAKLEEIQEEFNQ